MSSRWAVFWVAAIALGLVSLALILVRSRPLRPRRVVGALPFLAAAVAALIGVGLSVGMHIRREQVLGDGGCREIPVAERPPSFVTITCGSSGSDLELAIAFYVGVPGAAALVIGLLTLRGERVDLWVPTAVASAIALGGAWGAVTSSHDTADGTFKASAATLAAGAIPVIALAPELVRRPNEGRRHRRSDRSTGRTRPIG